jgi:alkanesulfonate monooxygenase SsuD/methylene tetrahydromethanopterin reductase-like flavin-dependent oxidoreductase (luciferase family)
LPPGGGPLSVAAFGDRAIAVAARFADRMLLDLVSPGQVRGFRNRLDQAGAEAGRTPGLVAWLPVAVDPTDAAYDRILTNVAGYLTVRGYDEAFAAAGYGEAV